MNGGTRQWFDQGYESFSRSFPNIAAKVGFRPFYVCPQCLRAFPESALAAGWLTREDVPPRSVGGRKIVLTCRECNHEAGHAMDDDMRLEADILDFQGGRLAEIQARLKTESVEVPIRLSSTDGGYLLKVVPAAARPSASDLLKQDLNTLTKVDGWQGSEMKIRFRAFSLARAEASWLRSAYLGFFAALGYRFVVRSELNVVRQRIAEPDKKAFTFRIIQANPAPEPLLAVIKSPEPFRSFAMIYGHHVVLLPLYGDTELYGRLAKQPAGDVTFSTDNAYSFPDRPLFLDDRRDQSLAVSSGPS